jgi:MOB kinase activator 1
LGNNNLRHIVKLPEGEDYHEWLAAHTVDFFNQINLIYGTVKEHCKSGTCPIMNVGTKWEFHWCEGKKYKRPGIIVLTSQIKCP